MSATKVKNGNSSESKSENQSILTKMFTPYRHWDDKEEFLDIIYWGRQVAAVIIGILWGYWGLKGLFGISSFAAVNSMIVFIYSSYFNDDTEEDMMEFVREGFMTAFSAFMVSWIMTYTACFHPDIFNSGILSPV